MTGFSLSLRLSDTYVPLVFGCLIRSLVTLEVGRPDPRGSAGRELPCRIPASRRTKRPTDRYPPEF